MSIRIFLVAVEFSLIYSVSSTTYTCNSTSSCGCSSASTAVISRIVGGEFAATNAWGWMVSFRLNGSHICGASLLSSRYAVTAAHCVADYLDIPSFYSILAGTNNIYDTTNTTMQKRTITKISSHPNYNSRTAANDIAILEFSALSMSNSSKLSLICLPSENEDPFQDGTNVVAIGWGVTSEYSLRVSQYLQQVTVQVISSASQACLQSGMTNSTVEFCAGSSTGGKDSCQGDSGGPLMAFVNNRWVLVGLTSFGEGCARIGFPGVYTRVSAFISFINANTNSSTTEASSVTTANTELNLKSSSAVVINKPRFLLAFSSHFFIFFLIFR